jgi:hypothetical protein
MKPTEKTKEVLTIEQRIEQIKEQQEQAREVFIKCSGAIEVLEQMLKE